MEFINKQTKLSWVVLEEININGCQHMDISYFIEHNQQHNYIMLYLIYNNNSYIQFTGKLTISSYWYATLYNLIFW